jgi:GNAT superfamily N-acetyltransferase
MELTAVSVAADDVRIVERAPGWQDVVGEIVASCRRRAADNDLWQRPGAIVVAGGAGPIGWVFGEQDPAHLIHVLESSAGVTDVYVAGGLRRVTDALVVAGWSREETYDHLVLDPVAGGPGADDRIEMLGPDDLADLRELLRLLGAPESILAGHYPDDFFEVCAPVRVLGVREEGRLVGSVAVRRQTRSALGFALNVAPEARGRGLGRALVSAAAEHAAGLGAEYLHAQSAGAAAAMLRRWGWDRVGSWALMHRD